MSDIDDRINGLTGLPEKDLERVLVYLGEHERTAIHELMASGCLGFSRAVRVLIKAGERHLKDQP